MTGHATTRTAVFVCDGGAGVGGGHVLRCLALGRALEAGGSWKCLFAPPADPAIVASFAQPGTEAAVVGPEDGPFDLVVFDGYRFTESDEQPWRAAAGRIVVIDDLADRRHDCDVLVDAGPARFLRDYAALTPPDCTILTGPAYALLRPDFAALRRAGRRVGLGGVDRILLSFGLSDQKDLSRLALEGLTALARPLTVDVTMGAVSPTLSALTADIAAGYFAPLTVALHVDSRDMAALTADADIVVGTPGTSSWERCALGRPSVLVVVADNQRPNAEALSQAGAALVLGEAGHVSGAQIAAEVSALLIDPARRAVMAGAAAALCDGLGAARVALACWPERDATAEPVTLVPATRDDMRLVYGWQADPATRRHARNPAVPSWEEHVAWFTAVLSDSNRQLSIVRRGKEAAGLIRLDLRPDRSSYEISILTAPGMHRKGIGAAALRAARRLAPDVPLWAAVLPANDASHGLFRSTGYELCRPGWYVSQPVAGRA